MLSTKIDSCSICSFETKNLRLDVFSLEKVNLLCEQCHHANILKNNGLRKFYQIDHCPIALARARITTYNGRPRFYDPNSVNKTIFGLAMKQQHGDVPPFSKAVKFETVFFMPIPKTRRTKISEGDYAIGQKDLDNLVKFLWDTAVQSEILSDDNIIVSSSEKKIYSRYPRVEFIITEV